MGNTVVPKLLPGDEVQQLLNGKRLEPKFIVLSVSKEGVQLLNQIWYPLQDFVAIQNKGIFKKNCSKYLRILHSKVLNCKFSRLKSF